MNLTQGKNHSDSRRKSQRRTWHKKQRSLKNLTQFKKALETQVSRKGHGRFDTRKMALEESKTQL